jgi:hypothetical protein
MQKNHFKNNKGFTGADIIISLGILTLFAGFITTLSYNTYLANSQAKRLSQATSYIVSVFEYAESSQEIAWWEDKTDNGTDDEFTTGLITSFNADDDDSVEFVNYGANSDKPYTVGIKAEKYKEGDLDLVKNVTVNVTYKVGSKDQTIEMTHAILKNTT